MPDLQPPLHVVLKKPRASERPANREPESAQWVKEVHRLRLPAPELEKYRIERADLSQVRPVAQREEETAVGDSGLARGCRRDDRLMVPDRVVGPIKPKWGLHYRPLKYKLDHS